MKRRTLLKSSLLLISVTCCAEALGIGVGVPRYSQTELNQYQRLMIEIEGRNVFKANLGELERAHKAHGLVFQVIQEVDGKTYIECAFENTEALTKWRKDLYDNYLVKTVKVSERDLSLC